MYSNLTAVTNQMSHWDEISHQKREAITPYSEKKSL